MALLVGFGGARGCLDGVFWADFRSLPLESCNTQYDYHLLKVLFRIGFSFTT